MLVVAFVSAALLAALPTQGPHQGLLAAEGDGFFELVVGPERLALYDLTDALAVRPPHPGDKVTLYCAGHPPLSLLVAADHFETANPDGTLIPLTFAAIWQGSAGARASRFDFSPENASTFHDHRSYHGGMVGMVGERHLEFAAVPVGPQTELQLYVTDAYRRPISLVGLRAEASIGGGKPFPLTASADCFVGTVPHRVGPLDVHVDIVFPNEPTPVSMDFYIEPQTKKREGPLLGPIEVRVGGAGFAPARIEATADTPVHLRFLRTTEETCGKQVVFPSLGITRDLPLNKPIDVDLVPPRGELVFTCGMRMFKGAVVGL